MRNPLRFRKDGTFHILLVSDLHGGEKYHRPQKKALHLLLEETRPDLVLFGGDMIVSGMFRSGECREETFRDYLSFMLEEIEERKIAWAHVFGNHDAESASARTPEQRRAVQLMQNWVYASFPSCVSGEGDHSLTGLSNYVLTVFFSDRDETAWHLFAFDSLSSLNDLSSAFHRPEEELLLPHNLIPVRNVDSTPLPNQVDWYYRMSLALEEKEGRKVPALAWMHNPLMEMRLVADNPTECRMEGRKGEGIGCPVLNTGLFAAFLERGDVKGVFFGHDHLNDFSGTLCGITLAYDGALYDMRRDRDIEDNRGGREIVLREADGTFSTRQIRLSEFRLPVEEPWDETNR
ncbi:MAG: metallophosphoesterase [Clostridia bacterium]|nr:metallophosphoesterase [Clostridia bacterium]